MDLPKTPSIQSLLDSDIESIISLQSLEIEELDEAEYALPPSEAPTLAEVLSVDDDIDNNINNYTEKSSPEPTACAALQVDLLQAISQQLIQAQERTSAGAATSLSVGVDGRLSVGTAHGRLLTFQDQVLRWVCDANTDRGAISSVAYNHDGTRILVGYARSLVCQYESTRGEILRQVLLGGELWGVLQVSWAGGTGLALDTGGSVWLMKFSRPMGVRSTKTSCLFSGARGEVVAMCARDARVLGLATLSRVIVVAGGRAAGIRFSGPSDTLPVLTWSGNDDQTLICARGKTIQWLNVKINGSTIFVRPIHKVELKINPLWLGWLGDTLAIFDSNECVTLWGNNMDKHLDMSDIEPVYASAFFKGLWTDGRVSRAMYRAGASALGGACVQDGALLLLGRRGVLRVRQRDTIARARSLFSSQRRLQAVDLLCSSSTPDAKTLAYEFLNQLSGSQAYKEKQIAQKIIKLCVTYGLRDVLWSQLWELCSNENSFVEALADAIARGEVNNILPSPDLSQAVIERLADFAPELVESVVSSLPLTVIDPHKASVFAQEKGLWRAVGAVAAALGGAHGAMRSLCAWTTPCSARAEGRCSCAGDALLLAAADGLAGRGAGGRALPAHARPSARHDALQALLARGPRHSQEHEGDPSPLQVLVEHDTRSLIQLLEQSVRDPPFVGPLGKQNRLRVARALLTFTNTLQDDDKIEIVEYIAGQLSSGSLPADQEMINSVQELVASMESSRADRAWLLLLRRPATRGDLDAHLVAAAARPRVMAEIHRLRREHLLALQNHMLVAGRADRTERDVDELFDYLQTLLDDSSDIDLVAYLPDLAKMRPRAAATILIERYPDAVANVFRSVPQDVALELGECLESVGRLDRDTAPLYLRSLCVNRPDRVVPFLTANVGSVRPEDALKIVRELGPPTAEPHCLEAAGDPKGALESIGRLLKRHRNDEISARLVAEACELCRRASSALPAADAAAMWSSLAESAPELPPALLVEALAYVPGSAFAARAWPTAAGAHAAVRAARGRLEAWRSLARVAGSELHAGLARARRAAGGAAAARGSRCAVCGARLLRGATRVCPCGAAEHAACVAAVAGAGVGAVAVAGAGAGIGAVAVAGTGAGAVAGGAGAGAGGETMGEGIARCSACSRLYAVESLTPHPPQRNVAPPPPSHFSLILVAPPRPDLEGVV